MNSILLETLKLSFIYHIQERWLTLTFSISYLIVLLLCICTVSDDTLPMRSSVSVILSSPAPDTSMSHPDYEQTAHDHAAILLLVKHVGKWCVFLFYIKQKYTLEFSLFSAKGIYLWNSCKLFGLVLVPSWFLWCCMFEVKWNITALTMRNLYRV